jgi:predicted ATP-grasp superfamily ATP-dependent carboligase
MRVFVYEFVTGGGMFGVGESPAGSLLAEGAAMVEALAADFAALPGVRVAVLHDGRLTEPAFEECDVVVVRSAEKERSRFEELAALADWTVVIAPEFNGHLVDRCRTVVAVAGRLLGPGPELVELAADKQRMAEHLAAGGIPVPRGVSLAPGELWPQEVRYPAVVKPRFGAGSLGVRLLAGEQDVGCVSRREHLRLEEFRSGLAASVACLCGPGVRQMLLPCRQLLSEDCRFRYLGGRLPLAPALARRAEDLALRAVEALPDPRGYLGIDLVLGEDPAGSGDCVIEVNPRLTTSYVGLRAASATNLARAMLATAAGRAPRIEWCDVSVEFGADGRVRVQDMRHDATSREPDSCACTPISGL